MGDIKRLRKQYSTPSHPWNKRVIEAEKIVVREYGLKKKQEIHIATSFLKKYKDIAKKLIADATPQGLKEQQQMMSKLQKYGLVQEGSRLDEVLRLQLSDILQRRMQTMIQKKGMAKTAKQARQFITHGHVMVGEKRITSPSYLVSTAEEAVLKFKPASALSQEDHPERATPAKAVKVLSPQQLEAMAERRRFPVRKQRQR
ncbi:30S ribosomal protein S4 [Candidatus Woesearchaeota archaeon]|nr:30S ribosomal protein S4 [Candidatus Woesearchaeota archaeon]